MISIAVDLDSMWADTDPVDVSWSYRTLVSRAESHTISGVVSSEADLRKCRMGCWMMVSFSS